MQQITVALNKLKPNIYFWLEAIVFALPFTMWANVSTENIGLADKLLFDFYGFLNGLLFFAIVFVFSLLNEKLFRVLIGFITAINYLIILPVIFYFLHYGLPFSAASLIVLLETNQQEAKEFMDSISWELNITLVTSILLVEYTQFRLIQKLSPKALTLSKKSKIYVYVFILALYGLFIFKNDLLFQDNMYYALADIAKQYKSDKANLIKQQTEFYQKDTLLNVSRVSDSIAETYILVIGESHSKYHSQLYGYKRNTNPNLKSIENELLIFQDVISPHNTTIQSLQKVLTFANFEEKELFKNAPGLIQVINKAGFDTYWISNQCYTGEHDSWTTLFSKDAKEKYYTNHVAKINSSPVYDEAVLTPLKNVLAKENKKKFIIVHLLGSHQRADFRYPVSYAKFTDFQSQSRTYKSANVKTKTYVNSYDNSLFYNDFIINEIINLTKAENKKSFVFYFSDHGEEVCEESNFFGHLEGRNSKYMVEIPMILWQSDKFKAEKQLDKSICQRAYQTDDVIHSILDLTDITCEYYKPHKSIFHSSYLKEKRYINNYFDYDSLVQKN